MTTTQITPRHFAGLRVGKAADLPFTSNMLIYGDAGVGKTYLAGSADGVPQMRKVLALDCESGANTLKKHWPNVEVIKIGAWSDLQDVYEALAAGGHDYNTVIIDSLTEVNDFCIDQVAQEARIKNPDKFDDVLEIFHWNKVASRMLRVMRLYRDLPLSTIFVAHMTEEQDKRSAKLVKQPLLTGQLKKKIPAIPDIVMYMFVEEVDERGNCRLLLTEKTPTCVAKSRGVEMPALLGETQDVTMQTLYDYIEKSKLVTDAKEIEA